MKFKPEEEEELTDTSTPPPCQSRNEGSENKQ